MRRRPYWIVVLALSALASPGWSAASGALYVSEIVPTEATVGEAVEILGRGFGGGTRVLLGEHPLEVQVLSPSRLRVSIPEGARSGPLVVRRRGRVATSERLTIVRFHEPPTIASFAPEVARPGGLLRIKGRGFGEANRAIHVSLGGATAEVLERARDVLIVRVPEEAQDDGSVIVVVARGGQAVSTKRLRIDHSTTARHGAAGEAPSAAR